jgi:zinc protease
MLELPETRAEVVDTALLLMREAAGEATLATEAIDRERGVVLSRNAPATRQVCA